MSVGAHPSPRLYVKVAAYLAVLTAVEVLLSYVTLPSLVLLMSLVVLAVVKFVVVVGYFMHLKFDQPLLRKPLLAGIITALFVYTIVISNLILHSNTAA